MVQRLIAYAREVVAKNLHQRVVRSGHHRDVMDAFTKKLQFLDQTRHYSISVTDEGWIVKEERDSAVVRQSHYQDWHRVERAKRSIANELDELRTKGWVEVAVTSQTQ